jgi:putative ABC transport system ATP-binding protein
MRPEAMTPRALVATAVIELSHVSKTYRRGPEEVHALRDVSLSLGTREVAVLLGPSGSGKSTLLNVVVGWERADTGHVRWCADGSEAPVEDRPWSDIAILPQTLGLFEELSIRENVELPLRLSPSLAEGRRDAAKRVDGFLSLLGLDQLAERLPAEVSIGEQQRSALARALVVWPRLLLADEPTGHQDESWAKVVLKTLRLVGRKGTTCLVATHNQEAIRIADRILSIRDGAVEESRPGGRGGREG